MWELSEKGKVQLEKYVSVLSKEKLQNEYLENLLSEREVSSKYKVPRQWVRQLKELYKIPNLSKGDRSEKRVPKTFTQEQTDLVIGSLLGDAGIYERPRINEPGPCYYKCAHKAEQKLLTDYLYKVLKNCNLRRYTELQKKEGRVYKQYGVASRSSYLWRPFRELFYNSEGVKIWTEKILDYMNPRVLAQWFADDGSFDYDSRSMVGDIKISTELLKDKVEETERLLALFKEWGLEFVHKFYPSIGLRTLILKRESQEKFIEVVVPFLPPGVWYKIPNAYRDLVNPEQNDFLEKLKKVKFSRRTPEDEEIKRLEKLYKVYGFPSPRLTEKQKEEEITRLKELEAHKLVRDFKVKHHRMALDICNFYNPHIWKTKVRNSRTPVEVFEDQREFRKVLRDRFKYGSGLTPSQILVGLRMRSRCPVNYPPATAKCLYDSYLVEKGVVLDPCAGYGGRLLGALCSEKVMSYTALEPCEETVNGCRRMYQDLRPYFEGKKVELIRNLAEVWCPDFRLNSFDLVFTSPPYFDQEHYSEEQNQVCNMCKSLEDYQQWIKKMLQNCLKMLKKKGKILIQVSDPKLSHDKTLDIVSYWKKEMNELFEMQPSMEYDSPGGRGSRVKETILYGIKV